MTKENFEKALEFLFPSEGGYVNNKHDRGGPTNMGITQSTLNSYRKRKGLPYKDVKNITREEAKAIYYDDYWKVSGADKISDPNMAVAMFDTSSPPTICPLEPVYGIMKLIIYNPKISEVSVIVGKICSFLKLIFAFFVPQ